MGRKANVQSEFINLFLQSAYTVLSQELNLQPSEVRAESEKIRLDSGLYDGDDINVQIGVIGDLSGVIHIDMCSSTALAFVNAMMGTELKQCDDLVVSGIAEMANVIAGRATTLLEEKGCHCNIAPPSVVCGDRLRLSTIDIPRIVIPISTRYGNLTMQVALIGNLG
jgi:chemotaxis protein CheX